MFASKRKWKALFGSSFFSALIGLYIQNFLFQHLNWIDKDNLQFFHSCKKEGSFHGSHPTQISGEWASFVQLRCPNHSCLPTQYLASFWPYKGHCPQYVIAFLYSSVPCLCIHEDTEEILEILMGKVSSCPYWGLKSLKDLWQGLSPEHKSLVQLSTGTSLVLTQEACVIQVSRVTASSKVHQCQK